MEPRDVLIYLALKYNGDWQSIYNALKENKEEDQDEALYEKLLLDCKSKYITFFDEEYPETLKRMFHPPFVLFYYGDISLISNLNNKIAVVGSRKYSEYGQDVTEKFVSELSKDFVIISGLAIGIDAIAHRSCIENGGKTVAVLGNGIDYCYLNENQDLYEECKKNHLVLSEYPGMVSADYRHFPVRNRIIAGLCDNLLVTEGKKASGTQITAMLMARKCGNVCCVPTHIGENSICNHLISQGAFLVETVQDIYEICKVIKKKPIFE